MCLQKSHKFVEVNKISHNNNNNNNNNVHSLLKHFRAEEKNIIYYKTLTQISDSFRSYIKKILDL